MWTYLHKVHNWQGLTCSATVPMVYMNIHWSVVKILQEHLSVLSRQLISPVDGIVNPVSPVDHVLEDCQTKGVWHISIDCQQSSIPRYK